MESSKKKLLDFTVDLPELPRLDIPAVLEFR